MEYSNQSEFQNIGKYLESKVQTIQQISFTYVYNNGLSDMW